MRKIIILFVCVAFTQGIIAAPMPITKIKDSSIITKQLLKKYSSKKISKVDLEKIKKETLALKGKSVPALIAIMKGKTFPEKSRWVATFLLGRIMGKKSSPFVAKFSHHPSWVMRMASLKTLLALGEKKYGKIYASLLKDNSFIVRVQALENIKELGLKKYASNVWAMLYHKDNYYSGKDAKKAKRTNIIKRVIRTVGDLEFGKAEKPLLAMISNKKYSDIFSDMDYSLSKITGKKSPKKGKLVKKRFWKKYALSKKVF